MCYFSFLAFFFTCSTTNTAFIGFFALFIASVVPFAMVAKKEASAERERGRLLRPVRALPLGG